MCSFQAEKCPSRWPCCCSPHLLLKFQAVGEVLFWDGKFLIFTKCAILRFNGAVRGCTNWVSLFLAFAALKYRGSRICKPPIIPSKFSGRVNLTCSFLCQRFSLTIVCPSTFPILFGNQQGKDNDFKSRCEQPLCVCGQPEIVESRLREKEIERGW